MDEFTLAVTGFGMISPVGLNAYQSCASIRAGINRMSELDFTVENDEFDELPIIGCAVSGVTDGHLGLGRWTKLASKALEDLLNVAGNPVIDTDHTGLYIGLPELSREGIDKRIAEMLGYRIEQWRLWQGMEDMTKTYTEGRAAVFLALQDAFTDIGNGLIDCAIVGGVDSLIEPDTLGYLHGKKRIKTEDNSEGLIPSEAAAFLLIETQEHAINREANIMAMLSAPNTSTESNTIWTDQPSLAKAASDAMRNTFQQLNDQGEQTGIIVSDMTGESYYGKELSVTATRVMKNVKQPWRLWHPGDCVGDTGAAASAINAIVAIRAMGKGYAKTTNIALMGASDDGLRGAAYIRSVS
jgi:3-oxoacyl-[acyl-carrier-protein] synthase-1